MKKIMILSNHHEYTYKFRKEIISELINRGHEVYLVLPYGKKVDLLKNMGVKYINIPLDHRGTNPLTEIKLIKKYYHIIKSNRPDIVLSYTIKPNIYGGLICKALKIPFMPNITGLGSAVENDNLVQKIVLLFYKIALNQSAIIFFQNKNNLDFFINKIFRPTKYRLIPGSGVNLNEFQYKEYPISDEKINFIFMGRIMKEKGIAELMEAAEYFSRTRDNISFHILGYLEDDLEDDLKERLLILDDQNRLIYHGFHSDVEPFVKKSHAILHPSYHEGLSNSLLEAAASGRPIIASDIPGCRETFDEGVTGFGFKPKSASSLIKAIEKFINLSYEEKKQMGILSRQKIENEFERKQVVDAYLEEINDIK